LKTCFRSLVSMGLMWACGMGFPAHAQDATPGTATYSWDQWAEDIRSTRWETGATVAGVTALGIYSWDWGSSKRFRWNPEGWFGAETGSGGADKLGHAFTSYTLTNLLTDRLVRQGRSVERAGLSAALTTQAIMLYVEVFDAYSDDHGFSREDVAMNLLGSSLAYARAVYPALHDRLDFRMAYSPSGLRGFKPLSDYEGQKYLLALKLGGFESLRTTPLRFVELQAGYYARGFSEAAQARGDGRSRHTFVSLGLNLNELLFGRQADTEGEIKRGARMFFEHVQLPSGTSLKDWQR